MSGLHEEARLGGSRKLLQLRCFDDGGLPVPISGVASYASRQVLTLPGIPSGPFTLASNGHPSLPITAARNAPDVSETLGPIAVTPGVPIWPYFTWNHYPDHSTAGVGDIFDGSLAHTAIIQTGTMDLTADPEAIGDYYSPRNGRFFVALSKSGGVPVSFTPTTSSIYIRHTGPKGQVIGLQGVTLVTKAPPSLGTQSDGVRSFYTDSAEVTAQYHDFSGATLAPASGAWNSGYATASGTADYATISGGASAVQSALLGAPGNEWPAGSVSVSGNATGPFIIDGAGVYATASRPTLAPSDATNVAVYQDGTHGSHPGGQYPILDYLGAAHPVTAPVVFGAGNPDSGGNRTIDPYLDRAFLELPSAVPAGVTPTLTLPAGFLTTANGSTPAISGGVVIDNGSLLPDDSATVPTMPLGVNLTGDNLGNTGPLYSNLLNGTYLQAAGFTFDRGRPISGPGDSIYFGLLSSLPDWGGDSAGAYTMPQGPYTAVFDGHGDFSSFPGRGTTATVRSKNLTGATGNKIIWDVVAAGFRSPELNLYLRTLLAASGGVYLYDVASLGIYPPDPADRTHSTPWAGPYPYWHPVATTRNAFAKVFRTLDLWPANEGVAGNLAFPADLITTAWWGYRQSTNKIVANIASVQAYTGTDRYCSKANNTVCLVTTSAPHGLITGHNCRFDGVGYITTGGGSWFLDGLTTKIRVLSPTTLAFSGGNSGDNVMVGVITPTAGTVTMTVQAGGMPYTDMCRWGADHSQDPWLTIPLLLVNDPDPAKNAIRQVAAYYAANLPRNRKLWLQYANENWNFGLGQYGHCCSMSRAILGTYGGGDFAPWDVYWSNVIFDIFLDEFAKAGRPASDVVRVMVTDPGAGSTPDLINLMKNRTFANQTINGHQYDVKVDLAAGVTSYTPTDGGPPVASVTYTGLGHAPACDAVALSSYFGNDMVVNEPQFESQVGAWTADMHLDVWEARVASGLPGSYFAHNQALLAASGLSPTPITVAYEGSPETPLLYLNYGLGFSGDHGQNQVPDQGAKLHAAIQSPRMYGLGRGWLCQLQRAGCSLLIDYQMCGGGYFGMVAWQKYWGYDNQPGYGTEAGASNVGNPFDLVNLRAVLPQLYNDFSAGLVVIPPTPTGTGSGLRRIRGARRWRAA